MPITPVAFRSGLRDRIVQRLRRSNSDLRLGEPKSYWNALRSASPWPKLALASISGRRSGIDFSAGMLKPSDLRAHRVRRWHLGLRAVVERVNCLTCDPVWALNWRSLAAPAPMRL